MTQSLASVEAWSGKDRGAENFPVGSVLIRARLRPHVHAYYAFARNADDIADTPDLAPAEKIARLDAMEAVLHGRAPDAASPSAASLRASLVQTGVDACHATDLLIAFRRDATTRRTADWAALLDYCAYSAMPVGRYVLDVHGEDPAAVYAPSDALCAALQVLNHMQDCAKDLAVMDRCYLPDDIAAAHGVTLADLRRPACTPDLRAVLDALLARIGPLIAHARELPGAVHDWRLRAECAVIVTLCARLAHRLAANDPLAMRVKLRPADVVRAMASGARAAW